MNRTTLVQKLWNHCNLPRDEGMGYGDQVEQRTYLQFLKMADERSRPPYRQPIPIPAVYAWSAPLALIFGKAQRKFDWRRLEAALAFGRSAGVQSPAEIVRTRPSCGARSSTLSTAKCR